MGRQNSAEAIIAGADHLGEGPNTRRLSGDSNFDDDRRSRSPDGEIGATPEGSDRKSREDGGGNPASYPIPALVVFPLRGESVFQGAGLEWG